MSSSGVVESGATTKHSVCVAWFRRDPVGGTIFVKPATNDHIAPHSGTERPGELGDQL